MSIVSYAQNFEDVMLWRALGHVPNGFYIDVGAQHPVIDSVSKAFYEHGWRGIHVEAIPSNAALLMQDRPDETVLQVALSNEPGILEFYEVVGTGLSTGDKAVAESHQAQGFTVCTLTVPSITLADVFDQAGEKDIHWLKIDVECMEMRVISGWGHSKALPWVVVVESTFPNSQIENHEEWEPLLQKRGYTMVYFDSLNRFYVAENHADLAQSFRLPPNIFDRFFLSGTTPYCFQIQSGFDIQENLRLAEIELLKRNLDEKNVLNHDEETLTQEKLQNISTQIGQFNLGLVEEVRGFFQLNNKLLEHIKSEQVNLDTRAQIDELVSRQVERESHYALTLKTAEDQLQGLQRKLLDGTHPVAIENNALRQELDNVSRHEVSIREQLHAAMADCTTMRQSLEAASISANSQLAHQNQLQEQLLATEAALESKNHGYLERKQEFSREIVNLQTQIQNAHERVLQLQSQFEASKQGNAELRQENEASSTVLLEKSNQVLALSEGLTTANSDIEKLKLESVERESFFAQENTSLRKHIDETQDKESRLRSSVRELNGELTEKSENFAAVEIELKLLRASIFWRITSPFRYLYRVINRKKL